LTGGRKPKANAVAAAAAAEAGELAVDLIYSVGKNWLFDIPCKSEGTR
jgi:hypothetical protein